MTQEVQQTIALLRGAKQGDTDAVTALVEKFQPYIENVVCLLTGHRHVADNDDYVQECLMKALKGLKNFDTEDDEPNFRAWLKSCAKTVILDEGKKRNREKRGGGKVRPMADYGTRCVAAAMMPDDQAPSPSAPLVELERTERILTALEGLPPHQRKIILLRYFAGMTYQEIADELNIDEDGDSEKSAEAVKKSCQRGMSKLRDILRESP